jgi:hypothetical protein
MQAYLELVMVMVMERVFPGLPVGLWAYKIELSLYPFPNVMFLLKATIQKLGKCFHILHSMCFGGAVKAHPGGHKDVHS